MRSGLTCGAGAFEVRRAGRARACRAVAGLAAFATRLCRESRILREAALLIRHALATLATRLGSQLAVLREAAFGTRNALTALASRFGGEAPVLREAAFGI